MNRQVELPWAHHCHLGYQIRGKCEEVAHSKGGLQAHLFHYMNDTFVIWPYGPKKLNNFLNHLSSVHSSIQFTMET